MKKNDKFSQNTNIINNQNFNYGETPIEKDILNALISIYYYEQELS